MPILGYALHGWDLACAIETGSDLDAALVGFPFLWQRTELAQQGRRDGF